MMADEEKTEIFPLKEAVEEELNQVYLELGKQYYEGGFEDQLPQLLPLFDRITRLKNQQADNRAICPNCKAKLEPGAVFCGSCGTKVG